MTGVQPTSRRYSYRPNKNALFRLTIFSYKQRLTKHDQLSTVHESGNSMDGVPEKSIGFTSVFIELRLHCACVWFASDISRRSSTFLCKWSLSPIRNFYVLQKLTLAGRQHSCANSKSVQLLFWLGLIRSRAPIVDGIRFQPVSNRLYPLVHSGLFETIVYIGTAVVFTECLREISAGLNERETR